MPASDVVTTIYFRPLICPACGAHNDAVTGPEGADMAPGDINLCACCCAVLTMNDQGAVVFLALDVFSALEPEIQQLILRLRAGLRRGPSYQGHDAWCPVDGPAH